MPVIVCILIGVFIAGPALGEEACPDVPRFIAMYGHWQSVAVRAEPASLLDENPEWSEPNSIVGTATPVCPGIAFVVEQDVGGKTVRSHLTYIYDATSGISSGVIAGNNGMRLRGEIRHFDDRDELVLTDFSDNVVWRETHTWQSDDEFESVAVLDTADGEGRIWFRTWRAGD